MKNFLICIIGALLSCSASLTPARAADVNMWGLCTYTIPASRLTWYNYVGQSGRFSSLGAAYYRPATMQVEEISNDSLNWDSGTLSLEFWAMPYYGANRGYIKMTRRVRTLPVGYYLSNVYRYGLARVLRSYRYPEFNLYEYTTSGWLWSDDALFSSPRNL